MSSLDDVISYCDLERRALQCTCRREVLIRLAVKLTDWKVFGAFLGFPPEKLAAIEVENRTEDQRKIALLDAWAEKEDERATYLKLVEVLYQLNRRDLVRVLCDLLKKAVQNDAGDDSTVNQASIVKSDKGPNFEEAASGLSEEINILEEKFGMLHKDFLSELKGNKSVDIEDILQALTLLPVSLRTEYKGIIQDQLPSLERATTIGALFLHLNPLFSFIDYGLLEYLIMKLGSHQMKQNMRVYVSQIQPFMETTTVAQLMVCWPGMDELPPNFSQVRMKFNENPASYSLKKLNTFRKRFCCHFQLSEFVLMIIRIESGSFYVVWCIPSVLIPELIETASDIDQHFYSCENIIFCYVNEQCIYSSLRVVDREYPSQMVVKSLNQDYLTCGTDGFYYEGRDYVTEQSAKIIIAAQDLTTGAFFSLKRNKKDAAFDKVYKECGILAQLGHHDNVIQVLGGVVDHETQSALQPCKVCKIMLEYSDYGTLADMLKDGNGYEYPLSIDQSLYYLYMILKGIEFLHENGVIHLNINPQTVLLFDDGRLLKLSDFSTAVSINKITEKWQHTEGRLIYSAAPEVIQEETPSPSSDIWSAMCAMVQMLTSRQPGCHKGYRRPMAMMLLVGSYEDDQIHELVPLDDLESRADAEPELSQLFIDVFKKDLHSRPSAKELLTRPIIRSMQNFDKYFD